MVWVPIPDPSRVRVASALAGLHQLTDLPRLIAALGHQPSFEEAPPGTALNEGRVALIGSADGFAWYAVESAEPARAAHRLARKLQCRGTLGGVMGLDPSSRRFAAAIAFADLPVVECFLPAPDPVTLA